VSDQPPESPLESFDLEKELLGGKRKFTRRQVADKAGVPMELAEELWQQLGFPHAEDDDVAFTPADVTALKKTAELINLGILEPESQAALVRTWGRSFARLAEWQTTLLGGIALNAEDPQKALDELVGTVLPAVESLQDYVWRRHLARAAQRLLGDPEGGEESPMAVCFVDIVGYTSRSKTMADADLVDWVDHFEAEMTRQVVNAGGRLIKTIGDEVLFVADDVHAAAEVGLTATEMGADDEDKFPMVRAGLAFGPVVRRLGDVFGPTVNIASRLTSVARPGTVLIDRGAHDALTDDGPPETAPDGTPLAKLIDRATEELSELSPFSEHGDYRFRRMRRVSVKGYRHLEPYVLRRKRESG
jgi:adenylate cyclase